MNYSDFYHLPVKPDGACFFNAISGIFHLESKMKKRKNDMITYKIDNKVWGKESMKLRQRCVKWLQNNLDYVVKDIGTNIEAEILYDLPENDSIKDKTLKGYFNYMKKVKGYAGQIEIYAISEIFQRNIRTFIDKNGKLSNVGLGYEIVQKNLMNDIYLYHNLGDVGNAKGFHHFEILFPKKKATIVSKNSYDKKVSKVKSLSKKKHSKKLSSKKKKTERLKIKRSQKKQIRKTKKNTNTKRKKQIRRKTRRK